MSGEDNFLARWSQRKREAKRAELKREADPVATDVAADADSESQASAETAAEQPFDLESLPKLDELTASTDIKGYLQKGVPEDLRNAALRKVWALDPAIRDYVSPALDYAYDWNVPGGVPGNGELAPGTDIASMVARVFGSDPGTSALQDAANVIEQVAPQRDAQNPAKDSVRLSRPSDKPAVSLQEASENAEDVSPTEAEPVGSVSEQESDTFVASQQKPRRHGGAMPHV